LTIGSFLPFELAVFRCGGVAQNRVKMQSI